MKTDENGLYRLLGELSADMKHVLRALEQNRTATSNLRGEFRDEIFKINARLAKVETFNTRMLAYITVGVTIGLPLVLAIIKWGVPAILNLL